MTPYRELYSFDQLFSQGPENTTLVHIEAPGPPPFVGQDYCRPAAGRQSCPTNVFRTHYVYNCRSYILQRSGTHTRSRYIVHFVYRGAPARCRWFVITLLHCVTHSNRCFKETQAIAATRACFISRRFQSDDRHHASATSASRVREPPISP